MQKIRLLIVDDHAVLRDALRALLSLSEDIEIVGEASEGAEAVEKVVTRPVKITINPAYHQGMSTSIATGLSLVSSP